MTRSELLRQREARRSIERRRAQLNAGPEYWAGALEVTAKIAHRQKIKAERRVTRTGTGPPMEEAARRALREQIRLAEFAAWFARFLAGEVKE